MNPRRHTTPRTRLVSRSAALAAVLTIACAGASHAAQPLAVVDSQQQGESLPPVGRSLFDYLVTVPQGDGRIYQVPYPYQALIAKIEAGLAPGEPVKQVLIPLGRSLQRLAAAPDFFKFPRVVSAVDGEPRAAPGHAGLLLKDRVYIGFGESASILEVISYNESAGRFEFQVVNDYRAAGTPEVRYADRAVCVACHQNAAPIFSRQLWDETNANPRIADLLEREGRDFFGVPIRRGIDIPFAIDQAAERANLFAAYQLLWREGCADPLQSPDAGPALRCRAQAFLAMLQYRLSGRQHFDARGFLESLAQNWRARWPGGLTIPDSDLPNRDPLLTPAAINVPAAEGRERLAQYTQEVLVKLLEQTDIPAQFEPLMPRPPLAVWDDARPEDLQRMISGLSGFIADADIRALDRHLATRAQAGGTARQHHQGRCEVSIKYQQANDYRAGFLCRQDGQLALQGRIYIAGGKLSRGIIEQLGIEETAPLRELTVVDGVIERQGDDDAVRLRLARDGLHARLPDGNAIEQLALRWPIAAAAQGGYPHYRETPGSAALTVIEDFAPVIHALERMLEQEASGMPDAFSARPFRRAIVLPALFAQLGMEPRAWCCVDETGMPPAQLD